MVKIADLDLALRAADAADVVSMRYFRTDLEVERKDDASPVTRADRECEEAVRAVIAAERPDDGFLGEETGASGPSTRRWILDGIDGTSAFIEHRPMWGTLIALEDDGELTVGVSSEPALQRRWRAARGQGAWCGDQRLHVSRSASLRDGCAAVLGSVTPDGTWRADVRTIVSAACAMRTRPWAAHPALLVASGDLDCSIHLGGGPWDHAALYVIVREAGGRASDFAGGDTLGVPTVYSNGLVHDEVLDLLAPFAAARG